ncbi:hypothetical protein BZG00_10435 [Salinivibrio kushneri]|uniref:Flagellar sheath protein A n=1 Tax=Salinivibrio kushneri TaxID=1908198 RepID=A0AB36JWD3_9GAMM|nr:hypothetical protein [Salinivibrio kushneri]OOE39299.1 hypothetical protein BZG00_10435 [Salinivibrio kushneri]QCP02469.1 hypothetical protein FCN78_08740 [Salinivibrio kushneri]
MFNKQLLAILIPLTLSGCGGGSDDSGGSQPKPTPKYTFEFAALYAKSDANSRCAVYGEKQDGKQILATKDRIISGIDTTGTILIQDEQGGVTDTYDIGSNKLRINQSIVPEEGYVTFVLAEKGDISAISYQKNALSQSVLFGYPVDSVSNDDRCVTSGATKPDEREYSNVRVDVSNGSDAHSVGITTPDKRALSSNFGAKTVSRAFRSALGVGYAQKAAGDPNNTDISDVETPREITDYKFFNLSDNATEELDKLIESNSWTAPANTYNLTSAALYADYQQTPYIWQNLPHSASDTITYRYDPDSNNLDYFLTAEGSVDASGDQWQLSTAQQLSDTQLSAGLGRTDLADSITAPQQTNANIDGSGTLTAYGNGAGGQAGIQRIAYQVADGSTTVTHVIYAEANAQQTVPLFDNNTIDSLVNGAGTLSNYDISVMYTENDQALAALLAEHTNPSITDNSDLSVDPLPVLLTTYEREQLARQKKIIDHYQISTSNP